MGISTSECSCCFWAIHNIHGQRRAQEKSFLKPTHCRQLLADDELRESFVTTQNRANSWWISTKAQEFVFFQNSAEMSQRQQQLTSAASHKIGAIIISLTPTTHPAGMYPTRGDHNVCMGLVFWEITIKLPRISYSGAMPTYLLPLSSANTWQGTVFTYLSRGLCATRTDQFPLQVLSGKREINFLVPLLNCMRHKENNSKIKAANLLSLW